MGKFQQLSHSSEICLKLSPKLASKTLFVVSNLCAWIAASTPSFAQPFTVSDFSPLTKIYGLPNAKAISDQNDDATIFN